MIELVQNVEPALINRLVELEISAFGDGGLNKWHLVPFIRHGRVFIIRKDREIVGLIQYMLDWGRPQKAYMVGVSTDKNCRGQGLGTRLLQESFKSLHQENITEIELTVDPNNVAAVAIYEKKLGFQIIERRENEYGTGENRLVMKLTLADFMDKNIK
ncbi:GNAT family N-acetyltransferase [Pelosinus baikalensis]|uniref:GNAT family N-acetyltransferase n=1 Tax=Pelosinus baikalensis TaxID=2892015 RepID=A0ABS8HSN6_9FIRM|nr:N-acetyltransferase [Pelosinus baikalensis]MCC5465626.1 GNAT family N-acetyltransferase [Pelosinus baikalensis]